MDDNKVTVDEPLISTDVDNLIRTIADKKKISLNDLRQECQVTKKNMDKWVAVLEEEGYISVEYGLGNTYIHWKGLGKDSGGYEVNNEYDSSETEESTSESHEEEPEKEEEKNEEFSSELPLEEEEVEEVDPAELLSEYVEKKRDGSSPAVHDIKSSILTRLDENEPPKEESQTEPESEEPEPEEAAKPQEPEELPEPSEEPEEPSEPEEADLSPAEVETDHDSPENEEESFTIEEPDTLRSSRGAVMSDVRDLMDSYMEEIKGEKARIEELKKEKENLYRERLSVLEGRMQADLVAFTERILEKQAQLIELKEHVLELPDKVDEVESLQKNMDELRKEGRSALERTREKSETYIQSIEQSKEELEGRIDELQSSMDDQSSKLDELERISTSLDERSEKLMTYLENARARVDKLNETMSTVMNDMRDIEETRNRAMHMKDEVRETVAAHGEELRSLETELEGISKIEQWIQEYVRDYETKIGEIEDYVSHSEDELAELKESAESLYLKKYLGELENMTGAYESELDSTLSKERDIDAEIDGSRKRITELAKESQEMIKQIRGDVSESKEFEDVFAKVKRKTAKVKSTVEEKKGERERLADESGKTRKSKSSGRPKAKAKVKAKRKKSRKKRK